MSVVVINKLETIQIYEAYHYLAAFCNTLFEHIICYIDKAVAIIYITKLVNDIESIQLIHSFVEMCEFTDIFKRVTKNHRKSMTEETICWKFAVCEYIVTKTAIAEMQGQEIVYTTSRLEALRKHIPAGEVAYAPALALVPYERSCHVL